MCKKFSKYANELAKPFPPEAIQWRVDSIKPTRDGRVVIQVVPYLERHTLEDRLDSVLGSFFWQVHYEPGPLGGVKCGVEVFCPECGDSRIKWDGTDLIERGGEAGKKRAEAQANTIKATYTDSFKRALISWGPGREIPRLEGPFWANIVEKQPGAKWAKHPSDADKSLYWLPPNIVFAEPPSDPGMKQAVLENLEQADTLADVAQLQEWFFNTQAMIKALPTGAKKGLMKRLADTKDRRRAELFESALAALLEVAETDRDSWVAERKLYEEAVALEREDDLEARLNPVASEPASEPISDEVFNAYSKTLLAARLGNQDISGYQAVRQFDPKLPAQLSDLTVAQQGAFEAALEQARASKQTVPDDLFATEDLGGSPPDTHGT